METNGYADSLKEWLKDKNNSSIYFTFVFSFIAWNWQFFYTLFFISVDDFSGKVSLIDYALSRAHILQTPLTLFGIDFWDQDVLAPIINFFWLFSIPAIVTYLMLWRIPWLNVLAHRKSLIFFFQRKSELDRQKSIYYKNKSQEATSQLNTLKELEKKSEAKVKLEKSIDDNSSYEDKQKQELTEFMNQKGNLVALRRANELVYKYRGYYETEPSKIRYIDPEALSKLDVNGLVEWADSSVDRINFTDKGKFFLRNLKDS